MSIINSENNDQLILDDAIQTKVSLEQETKQKILLQGNDNSNTYNLYSNECEVYSSKNSSESRINASNKIKVNVLVNYQWEQRYNNGNLIAVHKSGQYFAYSIIMDNIGKVSVFHRKLNKKFLLKSFKSRVVDLSFAHYDSQVLLGCAEENGCLQIFKITLDSESKIQTSLVLHLVGHSPRLGSNISSNGMEKQTHSSGSSDTNTHRIIWCMYIPEPNDDTVQNPNVAEDASKVFVLARRNRADIFHLDLIEQNYDCSQPLNANDLTTGHLIIDEHKSSILTACFSPDGSAFATASSNGEVQFFKISFLNNESNKIANEKSHKLEENDSNQNQDDNDNKNVTESNIKANFLSPKCLKIWKPHENKAVTSLYFLDDHKNAPPDAQFWSFILTAADYNREIKIWSCLKWVCLQTIQFYPSPLDDVLSSPSKTLHPTLPFFKTAIDLTSKYLVMSDITRKCFYVLHLFQEFDSYVARCTAISEYILAYPAVSFAIIDSQQIKAKKYNQLNNLTSGNIAQSSVNNIQDDLNALNDNNMSLNCTSELINTSISSSTSLSTPASGVPQLTNDQDHLVTMIRLYCIQTKQLQEMQIFLTGDQTISSFNSNSVSPPPPLIPLTSSSSSLQSTSLLQQLLPNQVLSNQKKQVTSLHPPTRLSQSISLSSDIKNRLSDSNDYEQDNKKLVNKSLNKSSSNQDASKFAEDSAIIQIVSPPPIGINTLTAPILMTPDAFINSPTTRKSSEPTQQKLDILQSFINSSVNTNTTQSINNLISSRTSSLTQVTNTTALISTAANEIKQNNSMTKLNTNGSQKSMQKRHKNISTSSSSSSSSSSSCSSSSCSSSCSDMDQADKEIAALSSSNKSLKSKTKVKSKTKQPTKQVQDSLDQDINKASEMLLSKVSIEDDTGSKLNDDEKLSKSYSLELNLNLNKQSQQEEQQHNWPNPPSAETNNLYVNNQDLMNKSPSDSDLKSVLIQMTQAIRAQNEEIEKLKNQQLNSQLQLKSQIDQTLKQVINTNISSISGASTQNPLLNINDEQKLSLTLQQTINNTLMPKLEKVVKEEINKSVQTQINQRLLDPLREQLSRDLAEKVKSIENVLKDNVGKLFKSKTTIDAMSQSISSSMQGVIVNTYREAFQKYVVPTFEKSCQNMYQQVNNSFAKGTQDYLAEFDQLAKQQKKLFDENKEPLLNQLKLYSDQMQIHGKQVASEMAANLQQQFDSHLRSTNAILQDTIISSVKAIVKEEIQHAMRDQQHVLPDRLVNHMRQSGTLTPVNLPSSGLSSNNLMGMQQHHSQINTTQDAKTQISNFLQKGQLNSAFQVALCAADLNLLMTLCELVNPNQVFEVTVNNVTKKPQCQLQQPVILSLIQQLSQDLNTNTELKVKYLEEALVNLDLTNALTREHTPSVMNQLNMKLQQYIQQHPKDNNIKSLRMLSMASQSLLNQPRQLKTPSIQQQQLHSQHHDTF